MHHKYLDEAIRLSMQGVKSSAGGPFGAVVVKHQLVIGRGFNRVTSTNDPTAHAEIVAIRDACQHLNSFSLAGCDIYVSCEPCPMCLAAIYWARIQRIYYAATREDAANANFDDASIYEEIALPPTHRRIPSVHATELRPQALAAFEAWMRSADRVIY
jgi:tRNA(Arg) A34 adenosine deaminase TadA